MTKYIYAPMLGQSNAGAMYYYHGDSESGLTELEGRLTSLTGLQTRSVFTDTAGQIVNLAVGSSTVDGNATAQPPENVWWYPDTATPGQALLHAVDIMHQQYNQLLLDGTVEKIAINWWQGETNSWNIGFAVDRDAAAQRYMDATEAVFDYIAAQFEQPVEFYIVPIPSLERQAAVNEGTSPSDAQLAYEGSLIISQKLADLAAAREDIHITGEVDSLTSAFETGDPAYATDKWHFEQNQYEEVGRRLADLIADDYATEVPVGVTLTGGDGDDSMEGGDGDDRLDGSFGNDTLIGGLGDDKLTGWTGNDSLEGGEGRDRLWGGSGDDTLIGGNGHDILSGYNGADYLQGDAGKDELRGGAGNDTLDGGDDRDWIYGGDDNDLILAGGGDDEIRADAGNDTIDGGAGRDAMSGNEGADLFRFSDFSHSVIGAGDRIRDFQIGEDVIDLTALGLTGSSLQDMGFRLVHSAATDRTYIRLDSHNFEIILEGGDVTNLLDMSDFLF